MELYNIERILKVRQIQKDLRQNDIQQFIKTGTHFNHYQPPIQP